MISYGLGIALLTVTGTVVFELPASSSNATVVAAIVKCADSTPPYPIVIWQVTNNATVNDVITVTSVTRAKIAADAASRTSQLSTDHDYPRISA